MPDDTPSTFEVRAMGDRVALIHDTPETAFVYELRLDQAALMVAQLVRAIREARQVELAW